MPVSLSSMLTERTKCTRPALEAAYTGAFGATKAADADATANITPGEHMVTKVVSRQTEGQTNQVVPPEGVSPCNLGGMKAGVQI
jgi:hypothetical protein